MATATELGRLRQLYAAHTPLKEIARHLGAGWTTARVDRTIVKLGIPRHVRRLTPETIARFCQLVRDGETWSTAAKRVGISKGKGIILAHQHQLPRAAKERAHLHSRQNRKIKNSAAVAYMRARSRMEAQGWPPHCTPREVAYLELFMASPEPLLIKEVGAKLGLALGRNCVDGKVYHSYEQAVKMLRRLARRGHLIPVGKINIRYQLSAPVRERRLAYLAGTLLD